MYVVLIIMAFIMLVPFAWMILTALKTNQEAISDRIGKTSARYGRATTSFFFTRTPC